MGRAVGPGEVMTAGREAALRDWGLVQVSCDGGSILILVFSSLFWN